MLYMVYSECHDDSTGCIINFIEGYEEAVSWAQHYFDQYCDTIPLYADFHWPDMPVKLYYTLDREFKFHPDEPVFCVSNGFDSCFAVAIDGDFDTDELMQIKEFDADVFPWDHILEMLLERNELEIKWKLS